MIFDKKNILVTGGAGFIGSHLCDELIKNANIICLDNFSTGDEKNIDHLLSEPNFEFVKHDIADPIDLAKLPELEKFKIAFQGIQEIYHLACPMSPKNFEKNKIATILANSYGIKNVLDLAVKYKSKFLHYSSSVIYGPKQENKKINEDFQATWIIYPNEAATTKAKDFPRRLLPVIAIFLMLRRKLSGFFEHTGQE